jgi:hypothetical protein
MFNGHKAKSRATASYPTMADQVKTQIEREITSGQQTENKLIFSHFIHQL